VANFDYPVYVVFFTSSQRLLNYLTFQSDLMNVIPETRRAH
jgi:hypothetical protein